MLTDEQIENAYEDGYADKEHDAMSVMGPSRGRLRAVAQAAVDAERRAIVAWLRSQAESNVPVQSGIERRMLALAIDSGEHLK